MTERIYLKFNYPGATPGSKTLLTGIRSHGETLYITGFYEDFETISFLYRGDVSGNINSPCSHNSYNILDYPSAPGRTVESTNLYGPDILKSGVRVVGNYTTVEAGTSTIGCMYEGPLNGEGKWITLTPSDDTLNTIAHSTMGNLVVGNYDTLLVQGKAFIYDVKKQTYHEIVKPYAVSITAYGIWHNQGHCYTICGSYTDINQIGVGYLVDWNNKTHEFSNWRDYNYPKSVITHFDGITSDECGGYNLTGDSFLITGEQIGFFAQVHRHKNCKFSHSKWSEIKYPGSTATSGNSVDKETVIGVYTDASDLAGAVNGYISVVI